VQEEFPYGLELGIFFPDGKAASMALSTVEPEIRTRKHLRSKTKITAEGKKLNLEIHARDATAMRASFNSAMKAIVFSEKLFKTFSGEK